MPNAKIAQWPTPWSLEPNARRNFVDANGKYIGCCSVDDASALVVEAVNERDRLRDIVKRIEEEMERCHRRDGGISQELMDAVYEARTAIGEGER